MEDQTVIAFFMGDGKLVRAKKFKNEGLACDYIDEQDDDMDPSPEEYSYFTLDINKAKELTSMLDKDSDVISIVTSDYEVEAIKKFKSKGNAKKYLEENEDKILDKGEVFFNVFLGKKELEYIDKVINRKRDNKKYIDGSRVIDAYEALHGR